MRLEIAKGLIQFYLCGLLKLTAPFSEIYYAILKQPPLYTKYSLFTLTSNSNFSNAKAKKFLDYKTRDLKETISDTINWLKNKIE